jgi:hypothetical protein
VIDKTESVRTPEVIVDFTVDEGMLSVCLKNIGGGSAYRVRTVFDKPFYGLGGEKCVSRMRVFREVAFMPPGKEFCQFVDMLGRYAKRREPMRIKATVSYRDRTGNRYEDTMVHDLRIYLDLGRARLAAAKQGG